VFRKLRQASAPTLMIASFALGYIIQNTILMVYGARPKAIDMWSNLQQQVTIGELRVPQLQLVTIGATVVLMVGLSLFLGRTSYGVQMRAAAEDFKMARALGVRADRVVAAAFGVSGAFAAIAASAL